MKRLFRIGPEDWAPDLPAVALGTIDELQLHPREPGEAVLLPREMLDRWLDELLLGRVALNCFPYLRGLAHQLNNPLTGILGYSQLLRELAPDPSPEREDLEEIHRAASRCRELIRLLGRVGRVEEPPSTFDTRQLVDDVYQLVEPRARGLEVAVTLERPPFPGGQVRGDPWVVLAALLTACESALHRTQPGGRLALEVIERPEGLELVLAFTDRCPDSPPRLDWARRVLAACGMGLEQASHEIGACYKICLSPA